MSVAIRVAAVGREVYQDLIVPDDNLFVQGALDELRSRGVDYNGTELQMFFNGTPVTDPETHAVTDGGSLVIVPDKPTGNTLIVRIRV